MTIKLGILASGSGSSFEALQEHIETGRLSNFEIGLALCDKKEAQIYERASRLSTPCQQTTSETMLEQLLFAGVDRVLGLGYLKKVEEDVINYFQEKLWNIHPSLIPKHSGFGYYGLKVHDSVIESGDEYTGVTIHMMTKIWDDPNAILNQIRVPVFSGESPKDLQQRILPFEYELMRSTLDLYSKNLLPNCKRS